MGKVKYEMNENVIFMSETKREDGIEIILKPKNNDAIKKLHEVRSFFERDNIYTDVLFYTFSDRQVQVIVRDDSYVVLLAALFRWQLIKKLEWVE